DGFKPVNDAHGHAVGDDVLVVAAQRLRSAVRPDDVVGRFGGDEFVVFLPGADVETARTVGERLVLTIAEPVRVGGVEVVIGTSVGIVGSAPQRSLDEQLRRADAALYAAKRAGRGRVIVA
ncbi:MAG TPA: GGDEF domain-containing protein, partial [Acidimicrobiales bacterium]|nr:GGDEF domain-containing protein [Acidimicrobiales bacterium]